MTTLTTPRSGTWTVQAARAQFTARGFLGHNVIGTIDVVAGAIEIDADHQPHRLQAALDPTSIDTGHTKRDKDLRGKRFLDVDANPTMSVDADLFSLTAQGWHCRATLHVAGTDTFLLITAEFDGTPTYSSVRVRGTAGLDLRDIGITVPPLLVRHHVDLKISAELVHAS